MPKEMVSDKIIMIIIGQDIYSINGISNFFHCNCLFRSFVVSFQLSQDNFGFSID